MGWEIKIWHEDVGERTRLTLEISTEVPETVVSAVAAAYWVEEVQFPEDEWDEADFGDGGPDLPGRFQG